jgi:hypothetical protein
MQIHLDEKPAESVECDALVAFTFEGKPALSGWPRGGMIRSFPRESTVARHDSCSELSWTRRKPRKNREPAGLGVPIPGLSMSLRFRRSLRVAPGVRLNLGLHGA